MTFGADNPLWWGCPGHSRQVGQQRPWSLPSWMPGAPLSCVNQGCLPAIAQCPWGQSPVLECLHAILLKAIHLVSCPASLNCPLTGADRHRDTHLAGEQMCRPRPARRAVALSPLAVTGWVLPLWSSARYWGAASQPGSTCRSGPPRVPQQALSVITWGQRVKGPQVGKQPRESRQA